MGGESVNTPKHEVDVNASIDPCGDIFWADIEKIVEAREEIADEVISLLIGKRLTVSTAKDILIRVTSRIDKAVKEAQVASLSLRRSLPTDVRTL